MKKARPGKRPASSPAEERDRLKQELKEVCALNSLLQGRIAALEVERDTWMRAHATLAGAPASGGGSAVPTPGEIGVWQKVLGFTTKQHCALQMMLDGKGNQDIADRMGVTESTAKVYVRAMFGKLGIHSRFEFMSQVKPVFEKIPADEYERAAGIPKTWHQDWTPADPHKSKYFGSSR